MLSCLAVALWCLPLLAHAVSVIDEICHANKTFCFTSLVWCNPAHNCEYPDNVIPPGELDDTGVLFWGQTYNLTWKANTANATNATLYLLSNATFFPIAEVSANTTSHSFTFEDKLQFMPKGGNLTKEDVVYGLSGGGPGANNESTANFVIVPAGNNPNTSNVEERSGAFIVGSSHEYNAFSNQLQQLRDDLDGANLTAQHQLDDLRDQHDSEINKWKLGVGLGVGLGVPFMMVVGVLYGLYLAKHPPQGPSTPTKQGPQA